MADPRLPGEHALIPESAFVAYLSGIAAEDDGAEIRIGYVPERLKK
jgi:hypothetical protein